MKHLKNAAIAVGGILLIVFATLYFSSKSGKTDLKTDNIVTQDAVAETKSEQTQQVNKNTGNSSGEKQNVTDNGSSYRSLSDVATSKIWKKKGTNHVYLEPEIVKNIDRYNSAAPMYVACKKNGYLANLRAINNAMSNNTLENYRVMKDEVGWYITDMPGEIVNIIQFGDQASKDIMEFNHWCFIDQFGAAVWYFQDPQSSTSAIKLDNVPEKE